MILQSVISEVLDSQNEFWRKKESGIEREILRSFKVRDNFVNVITGIRRCGKSTLLLQLMHMKYKSALFLSFEDPRLSGFDSNDFKKLDAELISRKAKTLFFDEIQELENWETYIRQKLDENYQVVVTGSNASLLSKELGTKLTGRHISTELFPFSYNEFLTITQKKNSLSAIEKYMQEGGFPEYLKTADPIILQQLLDDILLRDITVRYGIRDSKTLRQLAVYLISNIGKPVSATNLAKAFHIKSVTTILEYFSHLENAYILQFVPKFSYSLQTQIRNPKKVYAIDLGLFTHNSIVFTEEAGRKLENAVYLHYRRQGRKLFYYNEKKECDFIVFDQGKVKEVVQVCYKLNSDNLQRETDGIIDALNFFKMKKGIIVTLNQTDILLKDGKEIRVIPMNALT